MNELSGVRAAGSTAFLDGGGSCGRLIAEREWAATALGPIGHWPQSLKTATAILLRSPVPMVMLWGEDGVMLYNDAYSAFAGGRHPQLLGSKVREGWPEVADFNDNVMRVGLSGGTLAYRDQELTLHRHGTPEQVWMNLDYSPVLDESGQPAGVLAIVVETTERVTAEKGLREREERLSFFDDLGLATRALADPFEIMAVTARMLGQHMHASVCAYADMEPDENGFTIRGDWAAPGSTSIVGAYLLTDFGETAFRELSAGRPLITRDTLLELGPDEGAGLLSLGLKATVCAPFIKAGRLAALMAVHQAEPRNWTESDLSMISEATERSWAYIERTRSEVILRESEARLRGVLDGMGESLAVLDRDYRIVDLNAEALRMDSRPRQEIIGRTHSEAHPNASPELEARYRKAMSERVPVSLEHLYEWPDGRETWIRMRAFPIEDGLAIFYSDITERKQADEALQLASERAHAEAAEREAILSQLGEGVIVADSEGHIIFVNEAAERLHGVKLLGIEPDRYSETYHLLTEAGKPHPPLELPLARAVLRGETVVEARWRIRRPDGTEVLAIGNAKPVTDADGKRIGAVLTIRDETERHAAEAALAESEERLRLATEAAEIGFWDLDPANDHLFWPPRVKAMFGISPNVSISMTDFYAGLHPDDREHVSAEFARAIDPQARALYDVEYRTIGKEDGVVRWVAAKGQGLFDQKGECVRVLGTAIDITERKRAEQHQRLLIDELSHRAKNLLAIVQGVAQQSFKGERSRDQMVAAFEGRLGALSAAHNILTRERWESVPVRQLIGDTLAAVRPIDERIRLQGADTLLPPKTGVSLAMAIHELATNALKYGSLNNDVGTVVVSWSAEGGRMHLEWREQDGPIVHPPTSRGFGTRMIERGLASEFGGTVVIDFAPTGVVCTVDAPLPGVDG
ncbi:MAG: PAS domain S-box protein [Sphingomicrobium sp.]